MIIVSQDGLRISENMEIGIYPEYSIEKPYKINYYKIENDYMILGEYKTEERAKEVLQEIIERYDSIKRYDIHTTFVYEMPLE